MKIGTLTVEIDAKTTKLTRGIGEAKQEVASFSTGADRLIGRIGRMTVAAGAAGAVLGGVLAKNAAKVTLEFQAIERTMKVATGSAEEGARAFSYVSQEADRLGLNLRESAREYASLAAAAKGTSLEGRESARIFTAVSEAATALGLTAEQTSGALNAIQQMISKGTVSAEELRGQLGERLPGAFQLAAKAMGVTTQELGDMLQAGEIMAEDMLPKLAAALSERFGKAAEEASGGAQASFNRLSNAADQLMLTIGESGLIDAMADFANFVSQELIPGLTYLAERVGLVETRFKSLNAAQASIRLDDAKQEIKELTDQMAELTDPAKMSGRNRSAREETIDRIAARLAVLGQQAVDAQNRLDELAAPSIVDEPNDNGGGIQRPTFTEEEEDALTKLTNRFTTEAELTKNFHDEMLLLERAYQEGKIATEQEFMELREQLILEDQEKLRGIDEQFTEKAREQAEARQKIAEIEAQGRAAAMQQMFTDLGSLMNTRSRKLFEIGKAAAISETIVSTYESAGDAAKWGMKIGGPPLAAAFAGAAIASGLARVQAIQSTSFGSKGGGGGGGAGGGGAGGVGGGSVNGQATSAEPRRTITLQGIGADSLFSGQQLIDMINEASEDGARLIIQR